jgi:hypothetical protein
MPTKLADDAIREARPLIAETTKNPIRRRLAAHLRRTRAATVRARQGL